MIEIFQGLGENGLLVGFIAIGLASMFIGMKVGSFFSSSRHQKEKKNIEKESHGLQKSLQRLWEDDKTKLEQKVKELSSDNQHLNAKLEDYRKKLSGMGVLNFSGSKKRADILYSLLLENEALEQLLTSQSQSMIDDRQKYLNDRLMDIRKRQRLMAELFNDDTIKNYVKEVLADESKMSDAAGKADQLEETEMLEEDSREALTEGERLVQDSAKSANVKN